MEGPTRTGTVAKVKEKTEKTSTPGELYNSTKDKLKSKGEAGEKALEALDTMDREQFKHFGDWLAEGNYWLGYDEDQKDEKGKRNEDKFGWSADRAANELFVTTYGGVAAITVGAALLPFCPILAILIIAAGAIPRPVANKLKEFVSEETFGLLPLDKIPSPTRALSNIAHETHENLDAQMKSFGEACKKAEEALKKQQQEEAQQEQRQAAIKGGAKKETPSSDGAGKKQHFSERVSRDKEAALELEV